MVCFNKKEGFGEEPTKSDQLKIRILTFRQMQGAKKAPFCEKRGFEKHLGFLETRSALISAHAAHIGSRVCMSFFLFRLVSYYTFCSE